LGVSDALASSDKAINSTVQRDRGGIGIAKQVVHLLSSVSSDFVRPYPFLGAGLGFGGGNLHGSCAGGSLPGSLGAGSPRGCFVVGNALVID
jgi:hypothetical protein